MLKARVGSRRSMQVPRSEQCQLSSLSCRRPKEDKHGNTARKEEGRKSLRHLFDCAHLPTIAIALTCLHCRKGAHAVLSLADKARPGTQARKESALVAGG